MRGQARRFCAQPERLPDFLHALYERHGITDQVLFGDLRPLHRTAVSCARTQGVRNHVFEEGYFRPEWITLEREGVNANSLLPRDPQWYLRNQDRFRWPNQVQRFQTSFRIRALHDVAYHVAGALNPVFFPSYRTHASTPAPLEYAGYVYRLAKLCLIREREMQRCREIASQGIPYFVLPLQLNGDAQIRFNSAYTDMEDVLNHVATSFVMHAPKECRLVVKNHPLDMGLMNYERIIGALQQRLGLEGRIVYLEDGDLLALFKSAQGVVTVNSTAGLVALEEGIATLTLSNPVYNLPGLTSQQALSDFWTDPHAPDLSFFDIYKRAVIQTTQVNGGFYSSEGIALAVKNCVPVLTAENSRLEELQ